MSEKSAQAQYDAMEPGEGEGHCRFCESFLCDECGSHEDTHDALGGQKHEFVTPRGMCDSCVKEMKAGI